jgi:antitoxin VapB
MEVRQMETAKIFENEQNQVIRLPKEYHFSGDEVYIKKIGNSVLLYPKDKVWETFLTGLDTFTDDFLPNGRLSQGSFDEREAL